MVGKEVKTSPQLTIGNTQNWWLTSINCVGFFMETVPFYDFETKKLVRIPRAELRPGVILVRVDGIDEDVFVLASQLRPSPVRNHNFGPDLMEEIRYIQEVLQEVHPQRWKSGWRASKETAIQGLRFRYSCTPRISMKRLLSPKRQLKRSVPTSFESSWRA